MSQRASAARRSVLIAVLSVAAITALACAPAPLPADASSSAVHVRVTSGGVEDPDTPAPDEHGSGVSVAPGGDDVVGQERPGAAEGEGDDAEPGSERDGVGDIDVGDTGAEDTGADDTGADDTGADDTEPFTGAMRVAAPSPATELPGAGPGPEPSVTAQSDGRVVLDAGHVDLVEVTRSGDRLVVLLKDDTRPTGVVYRRPGDVQLRVRDRSRTEVPAGGAFSFLGSPGAAVWLLPQVQDPQLLWPGWSTERLAAGQVQGNAVTMRLRSVDGPGRVDVFTTDQFGAPTRLFGPGTSNEIVVPINTHAHANWAFSAPGQYRLTIEVAATIHGGAAATTSAEFVMLVGDRTPVVPWDSVVPPAPSGPPGTGSVPGPGGAPGPGTPGGGGNGGSSSGGPSVPGLGAQSGSGAAVLGATADRATSSRAAGGRVTTGSVAGNGGGSLARTGGETVALAWVGGALLGVGSLLVGIVCRPRRSPAVRHASSSGHS